MLHRVDVGIEPLGPYRAIAGDEICDRLERLADRLKGARIMHINATPYGGGVSELLRSEIPLLRGLGLDAEWQVIAGDGGFFEVTKGIHNGLQGGDYALTPAAREIYLTTNAHNAEAIEGHYDFIIVHDPQPAAIRHLLGRADAQWVWRCHIDTSQPNPSVEEFVLPLIGLYDALIFTMERFVMPGIDNGRVHIIQPAIDPLSPKNLELPPGLCRRILAWSGIDPDRPLLTQVSRFDPWKDPIGVLRIYREVRSEVPGLQLAMVGSMALDDPEGWDIYAQIRDFAQADPDITVATNLTGVSNIEVNAFQRLSNVVVQKSIREGFGLVVSETLWKGTPIVAGRTGGIPTQIPPEGDQFLVDPTDDRAFAEQVLQLLRDPEIGRAYGAAGREHVRSRFLLPRMVADELQVLVDLVEADVPEA